MSGNKVCYVCCFWLGNRRCSTKTYDLDKTSYLKSQIQTLFSFHHNLEKIIFVFNLEEEHKEIFERMKEIIPNFIGNSEVEIIVRKNIGLSYGAWSHAFGLYKEKYDYYIFNEDDYFISQNDFDSYLVNKFESKIKCGYLCLLATNPSPNNTQLPVHAGNSIGISSSKVLNQVWEKYGCLPHHDEEIPDQEERYNISGHKGQISQTNSIFNLGYNIFDIRGDYSTAHDMGPSNNDVDYNHVLEIYFHWHGSKYLFTPAVHYFNESYFYVNILDPQYQPKKTCYVVNMYFGNRRRTIEEYDKDRLCFLRKQIETLEKYNHNLDRIIFSINVDPDHYVYINECLRIIPQKIQNSNVELYLRKNEGLSYGAFSEHFSRLREEYDYFIFNEDDYFLVENNWDEYLIRKYNSLPDSGYLCAIQRCEDLWNDNKIHAGHSFGIASRESLDLVWKEYGCLPHSSKTNNYETQEYIQREFGYSFVKVGKRVYDIREEYRVAFAQTEKSNEDIWRWFWWNEKDLIIPAVMAFDKPYTWFESFDGPCVRRTNLEKYI